MKFEIVNINTDGYERFVDVKSSEGKCFTVHFLEFREYLDDNGNSKVKSIGDIIEGNLWIDLVENAYICDKDLMHEQPITHSSDISAVVKVEEVLDDYSIYAITSLCEERIQIEFESKIDFQKGDVIHIEGSLELVEPVM